MGDSYSHSPGQLRTALLDHYNPLVRSDWITVSSAWYGKQTGPGEHEFILIQVEDRGHDKVLTNYLVLDRNASRKSSGSLKGFGRIRRLVQGEQAHDTFRVSYDGDLEKLLSDCNLGSHRLLERLQSSPEHPLPLYELVVLADVVSRRHPTHRAIGSNPFLFVGLIWDTLCELYPSAIATKELEEYRGKSGWFRYIIPKLLVQDVREQALREILEAKYTIEEKKCELEDLLQERVAMSRHRVASSGDCKPAPPSPVDSTPSVSPPICKDVAQMTATRDIEEYLDVQNINAATTSLEALPAEYRYLFIKRLADAVVESGEGIVLPAEKLLVAIRERLVVPSEDLKRGLFLTIEAVGEQRAEASGAYECIFRLLVSADLIQARDNADQALSDDIAKELVKNFYEVHQAVYKESPSDQTTSSSLGDCILAQSPGERLSPGTQDLAGIQEKFVITCETSPEDIISYFVQVAKLDNHTSQLDHSQPLDQRGRGGYADVYRVATKNGAYVAVKCITTDPRSGNDKTLKRTARELEVWSKLKNDNILPLLGLAKFNNYVAMVSSWMDEGNVVYYVNNRPEKDRYQLSVQIVEAVVYLHSQSPEIVHGDIKGDNVLISRDGRPQLADFGLAITVESNLALSATSAGGGTMRWMAPELFKRGSRSKEADVYALGMTILEVLTGRRPFDEIDDMWELRDAVVEDRSTPQRPKELSYPSQINKSFWEGMNRCWAYEKNRRATVVEVERLMTEALI